MQDQLGLLSLNISILQLLVRNGNIWNTCWLLTRAACLIQKHDMIISTSLSSLWTRKQRQSCVLLHLKWAGSHPHCCGLALFRSGRVMFTLHSTWFVTPLGYPWCPSDAITIVLLGGGGSVQSASNAEKDALHHTRSRA